MGKAIGIDLGTTNSVVAFKDSTVRIIRNKENEELTRSCVGLRNGEILVGKPAYGLLGRDPANTILSVKRLMGGSLTDKMVRDVIQSDYYKYTVTSLKGGTEDTVAVVLDGKQYTPEQISAEILKKLKSDAEEKLGDEITHAVITVPAYFTEKQKNATRIAAQLAGLKVQKLLAEPTAAAIAYGVDHLKPGEAITVIVYDFGGGTFDLSILNIVDGNYMEIATGGDRWLGGDDLDKEMQAFILKKVESNLDITNVSELIENLPDRKKKLFASELRQKVEEVKMQLSSAQTVPTIIDGILEDENGDIIDIDVSITRQEFEKIAVPYIERSILMMERLLAESNYDMEMIDSILLVGGTSGIPLIKKMLSEKFGADKIKLSEKPMLAVAEGAGILAHRLGDDYEEVVDTIYPVLNEVIYSATHNCYIELESSSNIEKIVVEKQTPLPFTVTKSYKTTTGNQKIATINLVTEIEDGKFEGIAKGFYLIEEQLPIQSELNFEFTMDIDGIITVKGYFKGHKNQAKPIILGRGYADQRAIETIDKLIGKAAKEYKTLEGEESLLNFITSEIQEINRIGIENMTDDKWHKLYYTATEKFDEVKSSEKERPEEDRILFRAKRLLLEFGELLDPFDKNSIISLITQIESLRDEALKVDLIERLGEKIERYSLLSAALQIEGLAGRILEIPDTVLGKTDKKEVVKKLEQLAMDAKTKFKMKQTEAGIQDVDAAFEIIDKYKQWL